MPMKSLLLLACKVLWCVLAMTVSFKISIMKIICDKMKNKVVFVSIANAIAIIAVIIGHLDITGCNNDPNTPVANIIGASGSFQMPLFMCLSGYLFTMTSGFNKPYYVLINSKVKRLIVPFLYLSVFTFFLRCVFLLLCWNMVLVLMRLI